MSLKGHIFYEKPEAHQNLSFKPDNFCDRCIVTMANRRNNRSFFSPYSYTFIYLKVHC